MRTKRGQVYTPNGNGFLYIIIPDDPDLFVPSSLQHPERMFWVPRKASVFFPDDCYEMKPGELFVRLSASVFFHVQAGNYYKIVGTVFPEQDCFDRVRKS